MTQVRQHIKKAILPIGGLGSRFFPATAAQAKEMFPVYDTPVVQRIVEEAVNAGVEEIIFVVSPNKIDVIRRHFFENHTLEATYRARGKTEQADGLKKLRELAIFHMAVQEQALGDGHALLQAHAYIRSDEPVVVLFGDDIVCNGHGPNAVQQLQEVFHDHQAPTLLLQEVPRDKTDQYGIVDYTPNTKAITDFVEKPAPEDAPSNMAVIGKYIITPEIWYYLQQAQADYKGGEIRLADAFVKYLNHHGPLRGKVMEGLRFDTGSKVGLLQASLYFGLQIHNTPEVAGPAQIDPAVDNLLSCIPTQMLENHLKQRKK